MNSISERSKVGISRENILVASFSKQQQNPFDGKKNPGGIINFGTSENKLMFDVLSEKIKHVDLADFPERYTQYCDFRGTPDFRESLAKFLDRYMKPCEPIDKNNLFVMNGCGSVIEALGYALCDIGEAMLIPSPYYGVFANDLGNRMEVDVQPVVLTSQPKTEYGETKPFQLSLGRLKDAYDEATRKGINVKGIILTNPHNPLGTIFTEEELYMCLNFANSHKLHVISDEIYLLSVFQQNASMVSALALKHIPDRNRLHIVWGFSKDFAVSGFRCGLVHTWNEELKKVINVGCAYIQSVPTITQYLLQRFIDDVDWLDKIYIPTNQKRLREANEFVTKELTDLGIDVVPAQGGLYVWADFGKYVKPLTREAEVKLFHTLMDGGVYIPPGLAFSTDEIGWFRLIVAVDWDSLRVGMKRLGDILKHVPVKSDSNGTKESLENLVLTLKEEINKSDWLQQNTAEKWMKDNVEMAREFMARKKE